MTQQENLPLTAAQARDRQRQALTCFFGVLFFCMTFLLAWHQLRDLDGCDTSVHIEKAIWLDKWMILPELLKGNNVLWHLIAKGFRVLGIKWMYAASLATAVVNAAYYGVCCLLLQRMLAWTDRRLIPAAVFVLCTVSAIYLPWFSTSIYRGQSTPNVWHSPTQIVVRPIALLVFWMTVRIYQRARASGWAAGKTYASRWEAAGYTFLLLLSLWAKPSFLQAFIPALGLVMVVDLIRSRGRAFLHEVRMALAYVPATALMLVLFIISFFTQENGGSGSGFEIAPFVFWSHDSDCIPLSFLLLFAFPVLVFAMDWKRIWHSAEGQIALSMTLVATAMRALLIESGVRRWHGNFSWAYGIAAMLVWFLALRQFLALMQSGRLSPRKYWITAVLGWGLLALHLLSGLLYYYQLLTGTAQC